MNFLIVLFLLSLLPSIQAECTTKTVFPLIFGRKDIKENVILHDFKEEYHGSDLLLGGEYVDNSSSTVKGFLVLAQEFGNPQFKYLYSTGTHDIIHKVAFGSYEYGVGTSGTGTSTIFFIMKIIDKREPPIIKQIGGDTNSIDPSSEIGEIFFFS